MSITLFGAAWLFILACIFLKKDFSAAIFVTLFSMLLQSNNVVEGTLRAGPQIITSLFFIIFSLRVKKESSKHTLYKATFISFGILLLYICFFSIEINLVCLQIVIYLLCAYQMYACRGNISHDELIGIVRKILIFFIVIAFVQFLCSANILPKIFLKPFLFNDESETVQYNFTHSYFRLFGTFMEPSYCASYLVGSIIYVFHLGKAIFKYKYILIALLVELVLTFSSTGYVSLIGIFVIYMVLMRNKKMLRAIFPVLILISIFYIFAYDSILQEVVFDKLNSDSAAERGRWNVLAMEAYSENPLWGVGFGLSRASSFALCLLAEIGLIGSGLYLIFCLFLFTPLLSLKKYNPLEISSRLYVLSVLICMVIACPDMSLCSFWFGIYLVALSPYTTRQEVFTGV